MALFYVSRGSAEQLNTHEDLFEASIYCSTLLLSEWVVGGPILDHVYEVEVEE
jgi:hypothetical protein